MLKYSIPLVSFTDEESQRLSTIMNNVQTSVSENVFKYIMGIEPMENFDKLVNQVESFGIHEAIEIYSKAVDRYNKR